MKNIQLDLICDYLSELNARYLAHPAIMTREEYQAELDKLNAVFRQVLISPPPSE